MSALYFVTGSSGSGKTTLLRRVVAEHYPGLATFHVDALGTTSRARLWVERAASADGNDLPLFAVDGQERPHLVLEAARDAGLEHVRVVLIDCTHDERRRRLHEDRNQPELDHLDMYAWAAYLRGQADALGLEVIDTTNQPEDASAKALAASIDRFASSVGVRLT